MKAPARDLMTSVEHPRRAVRRWLRYATWEGALANVFITFTGGAFITGLALMLGANDFHIGLLAAIPFLAQIAQLLSSYIADHAGNRKRAVLWLSGIGRQVWWLVPVVLLVGGSWRLNILLLVIMVSNCCIMAATPSWLAWMADIVPEKFRGRYFGTRSAVLAVVSVLAVLAGGMILDLAQARQRDAAGFILIIVISCVSAAAALATLNRIPDPAGDDRSPRFSWSRLVEPLRHGRFRRLLLVFGAWNVSVGIAAPFFVPHMLNNLEMSFTLISIYSGAASLAAIVLNRPWGAVIDRFGSKPVIVFCAFGIGVIPLVWLFPRPDFLWILAIEAVYSGALWTGFNLAAFNIPIANSPRESRPYYLAVFSVATGLGFFAASLLGGVLAELGKDLVWEVGGLRLLNYHFLFFISGILRLAAAGLSLTFHEPDEKRLPVMMQFMGYAVLRRLALGRQIFPWPPLHSKR